MNTDAPRVPLTPAQVRGFWAAWSGWTLDGMDSFIFALVLAPALGELLPKSGMDGSPSHVVFAGSVLFAVFLAGWASAASGRSPARTSPRRGPNHAGKWVRDIWARATTWASSLPRRSILQWVRTSGGAPCFCAAARTARPTGSLRRLFDAEFRRRTVQNAALVTVSIIGLWAAVVYEPSAIVTLAKQAGHTAVEATRLASFGTGLLSVGTCLGCLAVPVLAERLGRRVTHGVYFLGMAACISFCFGWLFYVPHGLWPFTFSLFFLGIFGGNFAMYNLWLPEQYPTAIRATAFAFVTSFGRFIGAGVNFLIGAGVHRYGSVGVPVAVTALAFVAGVAILPWCLETRGERLPS